MMSEPAGISLARLQEYVDAPKEDEHLEFKEAKERFDFEKLIHYCVALANERGGKLILGVTDRRPRRVVGTRAFADLEQTKADLIQRLHIRIDGHVVKHPDGRVIVFDVPSRPLGVPIEYRGTYWMRGGEDLVPMTPDMLRRIFDEATPDFSAAVCPDALLSDLEPVAIEQFRTHWRRKSGNEHLDDLDHHQLLTDAELVVDDGITYAALILFGTHRALGRRLAQAEVIFEYRANEAILPSQDRKEYRAGFFLLHDDLWQTINLRNTRHQYQEGLFVWDIPTFSEAVAREAILNAVSHRDYRLGSSTFVRQFPNKLEVVSPGGFPPGITVENILRRQSPRNRRLAEALTRCGLVERAGQGVDRMFEETIREGKLPPDFLGTDDYQVALTLWGEVRDVRFLQFLEQIGKSTQAAFTTDDLVTLDLVHREQPIPDELRQRLARLRDLGAVEVHGAGRGTRYLLARRFYTLAGQPGAYTRRRGLDRATNKALLLRHIEHSRGAGSRLSELMQVLPGLSEGTVQTLLKELKQEGRIHVAGKTRGARWLAGPGPRTDENPGTRRQ